MSAVGHVEVKEIDVYTSDRVVQGRWNLGSAWDLQAVEEALLERLRQIKKWGHDPFRVESPTHRNHERRLRILMEEVGEIAKAMNEHEGDEAIEAEVTQVAAVALAWVAGMKSRRHLIEVQSVSQ